MQVYGRAIISLFIGIWKTREEYTNIFEGSVCAQYFELYLIKLIWYRVLPQYLDLE